MALGSVNAQLVTMLDAARADGSARVVVSGGASAIQLTFAEDGVFAEAGRDASKVGELVLSVEDGIVLEILGWHHDDDHDSFVRRWRVETPSADIAEDILRTAEHGYQCDAVELQLLLSTPGVQVTA